MCLYSLKFFASIFPLRMPAFEAGCLVGMARESHLWMAVLCSTLAMIPLIILYLLLFAPDATASEYRSMDGAGNNKAHPTRGMKGALFLRQRQGAAHYHTADGSIMPNSPNPRDISNALNANDRKLMNPRKLNDAHTVWGQFIDHDFTLTPDNGSEPLHVPVPKCDVFFDPDCTGNEIIGFHRSNYKMFNGTREQINQVSAYLDASMVYGSDPERAAALRSFVNGKLLIDADGHVPLNNGKIDQANGANRNGMRMTGDVRGNVTPLMLAYHSLFVREHNRYCDVLQKTHPTWDDETLYQEARRRVAAHIQHITYREYLPALLGEPLPLYAGYDPTIDAGVENLFAASTFRYGHAEVNGVILRLSDQWVEIEEGHLYLRDSFFNPQLGLSAGIEPLLRGMLFKGQAAVDVRYGHQCALMCLDVWIAHVSQKRAGKLIRREWSV